MAQYTLQAFRWSGTGYNAQYNTSYTAVIDDDDASFEGRGDNNETVSIDGGPFNSTSSTPYSIDISFTDTDGHAHVETFQFFYVASGGGWYFVPGPNSEFTVGARLGSYQGHTVGWDYSSVICFTAGTLIDTPEGPVPVQDLRPGQLVVTASGHQPLRLNLKTTISTARLRANEKLRPVRISAGALGPGRPARDLRVSRQHRVLLDSPIAQRMFSERQVLVAAIRLTRFEGVSVEPVVDAVDFHHLAFNRHEVLFAEGCPTESFYPGTQALRALHAEARDEFFLLFPEFAQPGATPETAYPSPAPKEQSQLIRRHLKNNRPPYAPDMVEIGVPA